MISFWKAAIVLSATIVAAQCLTCRFCPVSVFGICIFSGNVTCANETESCFKAETRFNSTSTFSIHSRGCIDSDVCGTTTTGILNGTGFTRSFQCCTTDLCNGATSVQLPLALALSTAVLSSLWGFWEM